VYRSISVEVEAESEVDISLFARSGIS